MITFLLACVSGFGIGAFGSIQPGPLMTFIIQQSIKKGYREGIKVACVPVITDPLILLLGVFFIRAVPDVIASIISFTGAGVLAWFGWNGMKEPFPSKSPNVSSLEKEEGGKTGEKTRKRGGCLRRFCGWVFGKKPDPTSPDQGEGEGTNVETKVSRKWDSGLIGAMIVNLLNPYLYIFAFTINAPIISSHLRNGHYFSALGYVVSFFLGIVLINIFIAIVAGIFKIHGSPRSLAIVNRALSGFLLFMAVLAIFRGIFFLFGNS